MGKGSFSLSAFIILICLLGLVSCVSYDQEVDTTNLPKYQLGTVEGAQKGTVYDADELVQQEKPDNTQEKVYEAQEQIAILRQEIEHERAGTPGPPPGRSGMVDGYYRSDGSYVPPHYRSAAGGSTYSDN